MSRIAIGAGLLTLDLILEEGETTPCRMNVLTGGSCGNVLLILSFLGWKSYPVAELSDSQATDILCQDLLRWGVKIDLINISTKGKTPIIIHRIYQNRSEAKHRFEFKHPETKAWFPRFRPVTIKYVTEIADQLPKSSVFYFDRVSPAALIMAAQSRQNGSLVVFEPCSNRDTSLFERALAVSHIVKFSHERLPTYMDVYPKNKALIEIQTMGASGVAYRMEQTGTTWRYLPSFPTENIIDTAGAGDWFTAGMIDELLTKTNIAPYIFSVSDIEKAILTGQLYGAINCCFMGARGTMYNMMKSEFDHIAFDMIDASGSLEQNTSVNFHEKYWRMTDARDSSPVKIEELLLQ